VEREEHRSRRLVLKAPAGEDDVQRFVDELGWSRIAETPAPSSDEEPAREIGWAAGPALSLHYVEDPVSLNSYVVARGFEQTAVDALARLAEERLDTWSLDELLIAVDQPAEPLDRARAMIRAGVGAPEGFDQRFFDRISAATTDPDPMVREAALYATAYSPYPKYRAILELAAREDPDQQRRDDAWILLESFDTQGIGNE